MADFRQRNLTGRVPLRRVDETESAEHRLTKHWYERPLTNKVKAIGGLVGAIGAIVVNAALVTGWLGKRADAVITPIVKREIVGLSVSQHASDEVDSRRFDATDKKIDRLEKKIDALSAEVLGRTKRRKPRTPSGDQAGGTSE